MINSKFGTIKKQSINKYMLFVVSTLISLNIQTHHVKLMLKYIFKLKKIPQNG